MDENNFGIEKFDGEDAAYKARATQRSATRSSPIPIKNLGRRRRAADSGLSDDAVQRAARHPEFRQKYLFGQRRRASSTPMLICAGERIKRLSRIVHPNGVCLTGGGASRGTAIPAIAKARGAGDRALFGVKANRGEPAAR